MAGEDKDKESQTEEPTDEQRMRFREEGKIASPREIVSIVSLSLIFTYFVFVLPSIGTNFLFLFEKIWSAVPTVKTNGFSLGRLLYAACGPILWHLAIAFSLSLFVPMLVGFLFTRFNWSWKKLNLDFNKINPVTGLQRLFGLDQIIEGLKIVAKFVAIGSILYLVSKREIAHFSTFYFFSTKDFLNSFQLSVLRIFIACIIVGVVFGVIDFFINWLRLEKQMRMSKQDLKEEMKRQEGDPHVKSQRRRFARDFLFRRSIKEVPRATFVVTNPDHFAIAIRYVKGMQAPVVIAKGQDHIALKIKDIARKNDIMMVENKPLARALFKAVKVGQEIPPSFYNAIIEVMKFIYRMRGKHYFEKFENISL